MKPAASQAASSSSTAEVGGAGAVGIDFGFVVVVVGFGFVAATLVCAGLGSVVLGWAEPFCVPVALSCGFSS